MKRRRRTTEGSPCRGEVARRNPLLRNLKESGLENLETYRMVRSLQRRGLLDSKLAERYPGQLHRDWYITKPGIDALECSRTLA